MLNVNKTDLLRHHEPETLSDRFAAWAERLLTAMAGGFSSRYGGRVVSAEQVGSVGETVKKLQLELGITADGRYGPKRGKVLEIVGREDHPRAASLIAIHSHGIPAGFTQDAEAEAEAARARAEGLRQQVVFEVFRSYYALRTATARVTSAEELLRSATQSADAARGRYQGGVGSLIELLTAESALASARAQRIQARLGWQAALVQLARDAGLVDLAGKSPLHLAPTGTSNDTQP